ncbi:helix-turn-helix domain-containing protein [Lacticaseibacillus pabuli]|uniref:Helix-turn-helix domain-containing protein n=1 Tax=Lacticaseibacillus pabuli TaxID=3025672 RepID=A0ABY7WTL1_9LACO|nr:Rgg/GadR/MutR family transcriptional regulator [Lacticaseibacillus sp. KACC 23028]WDF82793.1 helix-turn-helix domain-containing protein [Lacticaseibacillus sp. KACC 23028]
MNDGELFRSIRKAHNLTMAQIADDQCSVSFISKFERGEREITYRRLLHLLARVGVSIEEFSFRQDKWSTNGVLGTTTLPISAPYIVPFESLVTFDDASNHKMSAKQLEDLRIMNESLLTKDNVARWEKFYRIYRQILYEVELINQNHQLYADVPAMMASFRTKIRPVVAYLYKVDEWGTFELFLLRFFGSMMDVSTLYRLTKAAYQRNSGKKVLPQNVEILTDLVQAAFSRFIYDGDYQYARDCINWHSHLRAFNVASTALMTMFMRGWYQIYVGKLSDGVETCERVIELYRELGLKKEVAAKRKMLDLILKSHKNPDKYVFFT